MVVEAIALINVCQKMFERRFEHRFMASEWCGAKMCGHDPNTAQRPLPTGFIEGIRA